jgi:hypothetical protein
MSNKSKTELLAALRFIRRLISYWIEKADKDSLRIINGELGQLKRQISGKIKE